MSITHSIEDNGKKMMGSDINKQLNPQNPSFYQVTKISDTEYVWQGCKHTATNTTDVNGFTQFQ